MLLGTAEAMNGFGGYDQTPYMCTVRRRGHVATVVGVGWP